MVFSWFNIRLCDIDAILCQFWDFKFNNLESLLPSHTKFSADNSHAFSYPEGKFHQCGSKIMVTVVVDVNTGWEIHSKMHTFRKIAISSTKLNLLIRNFHQFISRDVAIYHKNFVRVAQKLWPPRGGTFFFGTPCTLQNLKIVIYM